MLKLYFLHTISHNSDMFRSNLITFRQLLNINKAFSIVLAIKTETSYLSDAN